MLGVETVGFGGAFGGGDAVAGVGNVFAGGAGGGCTAVVTCVVMPGWRPVGIAGPVAGRCNISGFVSGSFTSAGVGGLAGGGALPGRVSLTLLTLPPVASRHHVDR